MAVRRWDARFEEQHLVLRRWRLLPWPKAFVRRIPLSSILDIGSFTASDQAKRHAQLSVQGPSAPDLSEAIPVSFTREQWTFAGWFMEEWRAAKRRAAPTRRPQLRPKAPANQVALSRPAVDVAALSRRRAQMAVALRAHLASRQASTTPSTTLRTTPSTTPSAPSTTPVMRASDGRWPAWLWLENGEIHGSLVPAGDASPRSLTPADVAHLLLADPSRAMPAIRALTGIADSEHAMTHLRSWQQPDRVVVNLTASDLAGRRVTEALQKPGRSNPDGSVRTVSGGLPSLNKRRR
ncbi:hypothetical protein ABZ356_09930 [Micromonospora zamorensis]|uniref:hypothetical protein n=1 Tax=Micromonospora zamorensis TaxID=709883 RepID=UPI0033B6B959